MNATIKHQIKNILRCGLNTASPLFSRVSRLDPETARANLQAVSPLPQVTLYTDERVFAPAVDLQIVIPAYNAEQYLDGCMASVLNQKTRYSFHVTLVDDGAKDATPALCDKYADHPNVTVIHQENAGPAAARNRALERLVGRYVMFVDSDDLLRPGAIEALVGAAETYGCDIVEGGMDYLSGEDRSPAYSHEKAMEVSDPYLLQGYPCGKVFRTELFRKLCFPAGLWYEDSIVYFLLLPSAQKIRVVPEIVYDYRVNQSGMTKTTHGRPKSVDTYWITELLAEAHRDAGLPDSPSYFRSLLEQFRLNQHRVSDLSDEVQEWVFLLGCDLLDRYYPTETDPKYRMLLRALRKKDFGAFRMCCKLL